jgi:hypothetical protein
MDNTSKGGQGRLVKGSPPRIPKRGRHSDQDVHPLGDVKILTTLFFVILRNCELLAGVPQHSDGHDNYIRRRVEHEGLSFLTLTLPTYCAALEKGLASGWLDRTSLTGFRQRGGFPQLLEGFLCRVFNSEGILLDVPCIESVRAIRQLCLMFKKVAAPCSKERVNATFEKFVETDREIPDRGDVLAEPEGRETHRVFAKCSSILWPRITASIGRSVDSFDLIPKHGPGATAERIKGNLKYAHRSWHKRFSPYFPIDSYGTSCASELVGYMESAQTPLEVGPEQERPVRVITVPKTLKGPRIIAIEPVTMQFLQQSLARPLMLALETSDLLGKSVGFYSQEINQQMAIAASLDGRRSTLDLSEASDRVPLWLVEDMLTAQPGNWRRLSKASCFDQGTDDGTPSVGELPCDSFREAVLSVRSTRAQLPSGEILSLRKFASMGSAMCFPIESMVFTTILIGAWHRAKGVDPTWRTVRKACRQIRVYGDDLIVPVDITPHVIRDLETYGLKVNAAKSFWSGSFRESCGMDAFCGERVTPVYVRQFAPTSRGEVGRLLSWVDLGNQLYKAGYWSASRFVRAAVENLIGSLPHVQDTSSVLGWHSVRNTVSIQRWSKTLHRWEVKGYCVQPIKDRSEIDGYDALFKSFLEMELSKTVSESARDFNNVVASVALARKPRWATPW